MILYIFKKCLLFTLHYFFFNSIHLFLAAWVFVVAGLSLVVVSGGTLSLLLAGFSLQWLLLWRSLGARPVGFTSCGPQAYLLCGRYNPPRPGIEPVSPALAGRLSTPGPPGKPCPHHSPHPCSPLVLLTSRCSSNTPAEVLSQSLSLHVIFPPRRFFLQSPAWPVTSLCSGIWFSGTLSERPFEITLYKTARSCSSLSPCLWWGFLGNIYGCLPTRPCGWCCLCDDRSCPQTETAVMSLCCVLGRRANDPCWVGLTPSGRIRRLEFCKVEKNWEREALIRWPESKGKGTFLHGSRNVMVWKQPWVARKCWCCLEPKDSCGQGGQGGTFFRKKHLLGRVRVTSDKEVCRRT